MGRTYTFGKVNKHGNGTSLITKNIRFANGIIFKLLSLLTGG